MVQLSQLEINDTTGDVLARVARQRGQSVDDVLRSLLGVHGQGGSPADAAAEGSAEAAQSGFDRVWERIQDLAGTEFATRNGQRFSYAMEGQYLAPSTSDVRIPVSQFRKAYALGPVRGPSSFRGIFGPSIVWAVLNDSRVREPATEASAQTGARVEEAEKTETCCTWPDDCGADVAYPLADATPTDASDVAASTPVATSLSAVAPASGAVAPSHNGTPASPVEPVQPAGQEGRGFLKRIFGGR